MALSFEESKKKFMQQAATPMKLSVSRNAISGAGWTRHTGYKWFEDYVDDKISSINETKDIKVHEAQVNISQEINSQFVPFEMNRYYDGFDLVDMVISVHYTSSDNYHGGSQAVNVEYTDEKIRFAWRVDENATHISGKLQFEIHADGAIYDSEGNSYAYRWKSQPTDKFTVVQSLCQEPNCEPVSVSDDWVVEIVESVATAVAEKVADAQVGSQVAAAEEAATRAETAAQTAETAASSAVTSALADYSTTSEMEAYVAQEIANADIDNKLTAYAKTVDVNALVGDIGEHISVVDYVDAAINGVDVSEQLKSYALKTDIPEVPENISAFTNDVGYLTEHQSLEGYALEADIPTKVSELENDTKYATTEELQTAIDGVDVTEQLQDYAKSKDVEAIQTQVATNKGDILTLSNKVSTNETNIGDLTSNATTLSTKITNLEATVKEMADQAGYEYYATYGHYMLYLILQII